MSIEQTNQLILLILNSVLMSLLSAMLLGGAWIRQNNLSQQLRQVQTRYRRLAQVTAMAAGHNLSAPTQGMPAPTDQKAVTTKADLKKVRDRRAQLSSQYQWSHIGMLTLHLVLMTFGISLFTLALRALLSFDGLVSTALFLFTLGAGGLLAGTGCILMDLAQGSSDSDSVGQSLGNVMTQLTYWCKHTLKAQTRGLRRKRGWKPQPLAMLMPTKPPSSSPASRALSKPKTPKQLPRKVSR
ncbi:MAG: hypothetical protein AAFO06_16865 [Cyanobacteria bacterium J06597_16]